MSGVQVSSFIVGAHQGESKEIDEAGEWFKHEKEVMVGNEFIRTCSIGLSTRGTLVLEIPNILQNILLYWHTNLYWIIRKKGRKYLLG